MKRSKETSTPMASVRHSAIREKLSGALTKEEAVQLFKSAWWLDMDPEEAAYLQMRQERLCMPFSEYHEGVESLVGRPVYVHELRYPGMLLMEMGRSF